MGVVAMGELEKLLRVQIGVESQFRHSYGHDPHCDGLVPRPGLRAGHLVLTLDLSDPLLERLRLGSAEPFRLAHPYVYSQGEEFVYRHKNGDIEWIDFVGSASDDWPYENYPKNFASFPVTIEVEEPPPDGLKPDYGTDDSELSPYTYPFREGAASAIFLGDRQMTIQHYEKDCPLCKRHARLLACVPDRPQGAEECTWDQGGVHALFWYCEPCKVVITHNECD
jgi:hypothetical protein